MMEGNLEALENTMQELEAKRDDLLRRVVLEEDRENVASQVNDLLKARSDQTRRLCLCGYCSQNLISSCDYGKKLAKKLIAEKLVAEKFSVPKVKEKHIQTTVGLDTTVESVWNHLMRDGSRTLGFLEVVSGFDIVIWVVVSKDLQNEVIQEQILVRLVLDKECTQKTEMEKASYIYNILNRKKLVLLLDNIWSKVDLNKIGVPPRTQRNGSKILVTTRSKEFCNDMEVGETMEVKCLSPNEAWDLCQRKVGEITLKSHNDIPALAGKVAEKCCGLPLALSVIGKAMSCKETIQEWHHAVDAWSYDGLKDEKVKSCFLYCSLFPEDSEIGFIDGNGDKDVANYQGHDIIGSLVRAHLLMNCV
ncbi:hypothetical protein CARUB_v10003447mg [Capsella rubella]|uniref:NB-ARC domain-containing protein n=1 Tax=Capsella rubella TaxID=81985 RepID=R0H4Q3_9BRAS|nr:hypothetical protein CARUB_v10003447mg [Capsella rubella]